MKKPSQSEISVIKDIRQEMKVRFVQAVSQIISKPPSVFGYEYDIQSVMEEIRMTLDDYLKLCLNALTRQVRTTEELQLIHGYLFFMKDFTSMLMKVDKKSFNETLCTIASHLGYDHVDKDKVLFRFGDKGKKAFIILKGSISILIIKSTKMKVYAGDYIRYIANLLKFKEYGLVNLVLNENYPIFPVEIVEHSEEKVENEPNSKKYQRKKSRILAKISGEGGGNDDDRTTLFKLDQRNLSIKGLLENKAKLFTVEELLSLFDKEKKWREIGFASNSNADDYVKRINILQPLAEHTILLSNEVIEVKIFSYVNILTLGTGSFFGELALRNPNALRTASIVTNAECFFGTLNTNTYNTSLKAGAEKTRRQNVNFILSMQIFSSINHHIFQKKHFNNFTLGKCEKGTFLLKELEKSQWIFLLKEGSFEVTVKASLHELTQLLKYYYAKLPEKAMELSKLENDERNTLHLLLENKKFDKQYHEKKLIRITEVSPPEVAGLSDYLNDKGMNSFSLECKSPKGEYYQISTFFYNDMLQKDANIKMNEDSFVNKKYLFLVKRLTTIRKSSIMLFCGHKTTFMNEQIGLELEEESLRISSLKRKFDFKKIHIEAQALKLRMPSNSNNSKVRLNTDIILSPLQEKEEKLFLNQNLRKAVMTPSLIKTKANQSPVDPLTTDDISYKKINKDKEIDDNDMLLKIVPYSKPNEKVMMKSFNGRIQITRESNYFTKREVSFEKPFNRPRKASKKSLEIKTSSLGSRNNGRDLSLNQFDLTEMIWENVKPSAFQQVQATESLLNNQTSVHTQHPQRTSPKNQTVSINLYKKKIQREREKQKQIKKQTIFLMRMSNKDKSIIDINRYTQMKQENYIEKRNLYLIRDLERVNYKIGGRRKDKE